MEKWRVEEISLLLDVLAALLRTGKNPEWANVFSHFDKEAQLIISAEAFDVEPLKRLIRNIKNCFAAGSTFAALVLDADDPLTKNTLNLEFGQARASLWNALQDLEKRMVVFVN